MNLSRKSFFGLLLIALIALVSLTLNAQNVVSGEITGVVTDPSGAVVQNATVSVTNAEMGVNQTMATNVTGAFRAPLLRPGTYTVTVAAKGFPKVVEQVTVSLGKVTSVPVQLKLGAANETVEVTSAAPLIEAETANLVTNYNTQQMELLPSPGQDITNYALMAPGAVLSTGQGYGNYTAFGLPGTSNVYTLNGNDMNDPFNNLNNSGSSNNMLGQNEVQELSVVNNGYTGQYGRGAGSNVNITTKSGTNQFHGNARWDWNGSSLAARDWFTANAGEPIPHMVSNQWAGSVGGPIKKDKLFFFFDSEGIRYVLPGAAGSSTYVPTTEFANYVLSTIPTSEVPFYQNIFKLYAAAPGASSATPLALDSDTAGGCGSFASAGFGTSTACAKEFRSSAGSLNTERLMSFRVDYEASSKDRFNFRYWQDRGVQATGTDPINSLFSSNSVQPQDAGQMNWTRIIKQNVVNQFIASGMYYKALFGPAALGDALKQFPTTLIFDDGSMNNLGGEDYNYPQGRLVAQYQFIDDLSWTKGNHGLKFGINIRRDNVGDYTPGVLTSGWIDILDMNDFVHGDLGYTDNGSNYRQRFARIKDGQMSWYTMGIYAQDEWKATDKLKITAALRVDRNSNQACRNNCYSELNGAFQTLTHNAATPYNQVIQTGLNSAFPSIERAVFQPRFGFAYQAKQNTVIRGGIGIFSDLYPGQLGHNVITNAPNVADFTIYSGLVAPVAGGAIGLAQATNAAFQSTFFSGGTLSQIQAAVAPATFNPPNFVEFPQHLLNPRYTEWNLQLEQAIGKKTAVTVNYVGNHGSNLLVINRTQNAYNASGYFTLPTAPLDPRFGQITQYTNAGISNYNGVTATLTRRFSKSFQGSLNYTWSHSLDDTSNGGLQGYNLATSGGTVLNWLDRTSLKRYNYADSDYDFRHVLTANYTWELPFKTANAALNKLVGGWQVNGTVYVRSAVPYSVINATAVGKIKNMASGTVLANWLGGDPSNCSDPNKACLTKAQFTAAGSQTALGNVRRNFFRGPGYFNSDFSVMKNVNITERVVFTLGANAFNVFNHPNFAAPNGSLSSGTFGTIQSTVVPPSSPYGNFQGGTFGRLLQLEMKLKF